MATGLPDNTIRVWITKALGYDAKIPVWEVEPWTVQYHETPNDMSENAYGSALSDIKGRPIVVIHDIESGVSVDADVSDRWTRQVGQVDLARVLGAIHSKSNPVFVRLTDGTDNYVGAKTGQLPAALDGLSLKVKEQSPISGYATSANQATINTTLTSIKNAVEIMDDWDESDRCKVNINIPSSVVGGQNSDVDTTAEALASTAACKSVLVQAALDNSSYVLVGGSTNQYIKLEAGDSVVIPVDDISSIYVKGGAANQVVNYLYVN